MSDSGEYLVKTSFLEKIILSLVISLFLFSSSADAAVLLDKIVATVKDEVITWGELINVITMEGRQYLRGI